MIIIISFSLVLSNLIKNIKQETMNWGKDFGGIKAWSTTMFPWDAMAAPLYHDWGVQWFSITLLLIKLILNVMRLNCIRICRCLKSQYFPLWLHFRLASVGTQSEKFQVLFQCNFYWDLIHNCDEWLIDWRDIYKSLITIIITV
jgi:hypothetical protein